MSKCMSCDDTGWVAGDDGGIWTCYRCTPSPVIEPHALADLKTALLGLCDDVGDCKDWKGTEVCAEIRRIVKENT